MNWLTQPVPLWRPLTALAVADWAMIFLLSSQLIHPSEFDPLLPVVTVRFEVGQLQRRRVATTRW